MTEKEIDVNSLKDIPGIGPVGQKRLEARGITSMRLLYTEISPVELASITGMKKEKADEAFEFIRESLESSKKIDKQTRTARELYEEQLNETSISTGCHQLDGLFGNGVKAGYLTEFRGENGSGKTQVSISLVLSVLEESPENQAAYIDTEGKLKINRIMSILRAKGKTDEEAFEYLDRIKILRPLTSDDQLRDIMEVSQLADSGTPIKILVVDSIVSLYNGEYMERGVMKQKFNLIKPMMRKLKNIAEIYKIPVICVNTVYEKPDIMYGKDPIIPAGGNSVGHVLAYRVKLEAVGSGKTHRATMVKSPEHANNQAIFQITEKGIEDVKVE